MRDPRILRCAERRSIDRLLRSSARSDLRVARLAASAPTWSPACHPRGGVTPACRAKTRIRASALAAAGSRPAVLSRFIAPRDADRRNRIAGMGRSRRSSLSSSAELSDAHPPLLSDWILVRSDCGMHHRKLFGRTFCCVLFQHFYALANPGSTERRRAVRNAKAYGFVSRDRIRLGFPDLV